MWQSVRHARSVQGPDADTARSQAGRQRTTLNGSRRLVRSVRTPVAGMARSSAGMAIILLTGSRRQEPSARTLAGATVLSTGGVAAHILSAGSRRHGPSVPTQAAGMATSAGAARSSRRNRQFRRATSHSRSAFVLHFASASSLKTNTSSCWLPAWMGTQHFTRTTA